MPYHTRYHARECLGACKLWGVPGYILWWYPGISSGGTRYLPEILWGYPVPMTRVYSGGTRYLPEYDHINQVWYLSTPECIYWSIPHTLLIHILDVILYRRTLLHSSIAFPEWVSEWYETTLTRNQGFITLLAAPVTLHITTRYKYTYASRYYNFMQTVQLLVLQENHTPARLHTANGRCTRTRHLHHSLQRDLLNRVDTVCFLVCMRQELRFPIRRIIVYTSSTDIHVASPRSFF